jgi:hypothetical protein
VLLLLARTLSGFSHSVPPSSSRDLERARLSYTLIPRASPVARSTWS